MYLVSSTPKEEAIIYIFGAIYSLVTSHFFLTSPQLSSFSSLDFQRLDSVRTIEERPPPSPSAMIRAAVAASNKIRAHYLEKIANFDRSVVCTVYYSAGHQVTRYV